MGREMGAWFFEDDAWKRAVASRCDGDEHVHTPTLDVTQ